MNDDYAIVIGIDSYATKTDESGFSPLTSAVRDANAFMQWLVSPTGGDIHNDPTPGKRRIIPIFSPPVLNTQLPSPTDAKPVKDQVDDAMTEFGFNGIKRPIGRRFYFYFSGHGISMGSSDVAMLMANAFKSMESRNIGLRTYREYLQERHLFDEVIFIADCCRNRETKPIDLGKPGFTVERDKDTPQMKDATFLAAEYGEPSFAISDGQGLLTKALIEGLNGNPEAVDQKGRVTSNTLNNFIPKRVRSLARENLLRQNPEMDLFPKKAEIIFCKPKNKVTIQIVAAANLNGDLIVCDGEDQELFRREAKLATEDSPWEIELFDSFVPYSVKITGFSNPIRFELADVKEKGNVLQIP
jgi:hypothetical protein